MNLRAVCGDKQFCRRSYLQTTKKTLALPGVELGIAMRGMRFELWLATTAIALVAAGLNLPVQSAPLTEDEISAEIGRASCRERV